MRAPSDNVVVCTGTTIHKLREVKIEMTCESRMSWFNYFGLFLSLLVSRFELLFSCCTWKANIIDSTYEYRLISVDVRLGCQPKSDPTRYSVPHDCEIPLSLHVGCKNRSTYGLDVENLQKLDEVTNSYSFRLTKIWSIDCYPCLLVVSCIICVTQTSVAILFENWKSLAS